MNDGTGKSWDAVWRPKVAVQKYDSRSLAEFSTVLHCMPYYYAFEYITIFTRESSYRFQRVLAIAILSVRPYVSLSHR